jgi:hypothetical protein
MQNIMKSPVYSRMSQDSVAGTATGYGLDGPGRDFPRQSRPAPGPIHPSIKWVPGILPKDTVTGSAVDHPPILALSLKNEYCSCNRTLCRHGLF